MKLDLRRRDALFAALEAQVFDVAVIGGGITGAGVARDAAMRGLTVALVEAADFARGTSSRSSKMIHGGLRYLAMGDVALVREAASERKIVEAIAPHLARRTPFVIPARNAAAIASLRAGLWAFEKLGAVPKDLRHQVWSLADLRAREPTVAAEGFAGAVVYPEYLTDDARLTVANARSAAAHGAVCLNYAPAQAILTEGGRAVGLTVGDGLSGGHGARLRARLVVNAAGPWVDALRVLEDAAASPRLKLSKGVHLVVARERLPVGGVVIMPAADRRSVFAVPKGAATYIGTTDTFHVDAEAWPPITRADADYLLAAAAARFNVRPLTMDDVRSAWSGVRPLVGEEGKSASDISRRDEVWTGPAGVVSIAGGKLTAYRKMAERVVDAIVETLGRKAGPARTAKEPLPGGEGPAGDIAAVAGGERIAALYGAEAAAIVADGADAAAEARHAVLSEGAVTLEDYWVRRSARAWFDVGAGLPVLPAAAAAMAPLLGWTDAEASRQVEACRALHAAIMAPLRGERAAA